MDYQILTARDIDALIPLYIGYYNECEGGEWTPETVRGRLRPIVTREDSFGLVQTQDGEITGFACGYFEQFDDGKAYDLIEIVVWKKYQSRGFGTALLNELEKRAKAMGAFMVSLQAVNDERHHRFYGRLGYQNCGNFVIKVKEL